MDYNVFKSEVRNRVSLASDPGSEVELRSIRKLNGVMLDGITIMKHGSKIAPTIYLDHYFDMYQEGCSLDLIVGYILRENEARQVRRFPEEMNLRDFEFVRPRLGLRLVNTAMNREMLFGVPHFQVLDLAAVCYYRLSLPEADNGAVMVKNEDLVLWDVEEEELFREALAGSLANEPAVSEPLWQMLKEMSGLDTDESSEYRSEQLYVLTNKSRSFGAACMLYPHVLENLAETLGSDLVILPSSVHEVLLMPCSPLFSKEDCDTLVAEINATEVARYEVLSNHVYFYSRDEQKMKM